MRRVSAAVAMLFAALLVIATPATAQTPDTYGDYSRFGQRAAGQLWQGGQAASQFAWNPRSPAVSYIDWGEPASWPPATYERFERDGDWLVMVGYGNYTTGEFLPQNVTSQRRGDVNCQNMIPLAHNGRQRYVQWTIPSTAYCLHTVGFMIHQGVRIDFEHYQVFWPPSGPTCNNAYYTGQRCIKMHERWNDNNGAPGAPLTEKIRRDNILAKGKGWFIIHDWRTGWHAAGRYYWMY